jgi:hypothetical protein
MFAHFAGIGIGHSVQYNLSKDTECKHGPGSCDDELDIVMSDSPIFDSDAGHHGNQTQSEENDGDENNEYDDEYNDDDGNDDDDDDDDDAWDNKDEDEDNDSEEYKYSEDEGPEYKF